MIFQFSDGNRLRFLRVSRSVACFVTAALLVSACGKPERKAPPATAVSVAVATQKSIHPSYRSVGRTAANENINITARITGNLLKRNFQEGQHVQPGQILFEIDPAPYQQKVADAKAQLKRDQAASHVALLDFKRGQQLIHTGDISQSDMDTLRSTKLQSAANVKSSQANLKTAQLNLGYTKIYAPLGGVIGRSQVSIGDLITADNGILVNIVNINPIYAYFDVSETTFLQFNQGRTEGAVPGVTVKLQLSDDSWYDQSGVIDFVDNRVNTDTGTIQVRAVFPNAKRMLLPGQYVTVVVQKEAVENVIAIPQVAIQEDQRGTFVMMVDKQNTAKTQLVTLGDNMGRDVMVKSGLQAGDRVITEGLQKIRPNQKVTIKAAKPLPDNTPNPSSSSSH